MKVALGISTALVAFAAGIGALHSADREVEQSSVRVTDLAQYAGQDSPWH